MNLLPFDIAAAEPGKPRPPTAGRRIGWRQRVLPALVALVCLAPVWAAGPANVLKPETLRVGFNKNAFLSMNRNDVEDSFKAFTETVGRQRSYLITSRTQVFDENPAFEAAIQSGAVELSIMDTWSYLEMGIQEATEPCFVGATDAGPGRRHLGLTCRESGLNTLADLRGKTIVEFAIANATLGRRWLETLLLESRLGTHDTFFDGVETVGKPSSAVLSVFFGKRPACLVDEDGFTVMKELNPQVGNQLQVGAISESMVNAVICLKRSGWSSEQYKQDLIRGLAELHLETSGQQILTLFKVREQVPFQESQLDTIRKLRATHHQWQKEATP